MSKPSAFRHLELTQPERRTALLLAAGTLLLPLQIWPPMPLAGMQLSDLLFALAFLHFAAARRGVPPTAIASAASGSPRRPCCRTPSSASARGVPVANGWSAHNTWLNLWAGIGVVPLAAFAFLMLAALRAALVARHLGLACALIVALVESDYIDIEDLHHV